MYGTKATLNSVHVSRDGGLESCAEKMQRARTSWEQGTLFWHLVKEPQKKTGPFFQIVTIITAKSKGHSQETGAASR